MTLGRLFVAAVVVGASLLCVRLGVWQLSRWGEKRALNAALRAALAAPPADLGAALPALGAVRDRPIRLQGRFDPHFQVLLRGRPRDGEPGVIVATPFVLEGDSVAVVVERGWLAAEDAATLAAGAIPDDPATSLVGLAQPFPERVPIPPMREMGTPDRRVWSAPRLHSDSLGARLPYRLAPFVLQALPGHGAPASPLRDVPRPLDQTMHLGYALQWFAIAVLAPLVAWFATRRTRLRGVPPSASRGDSAR